MVERIETSKGFIVYKISFMDALALHGGNPVYCDICDEFTGHEFLYFIPVLNVYYCPDHYNAWYDGATFYVVDHPNELRRAEDFANACLVAGFEVVQGAEVES